MNTINAFATLTAVVVAAAAMTPATTWAAGDAPACDPATGCVPSPPPPPTPPPGPTPSPSGPPAVTPAPIGGVPSRVRLASVTVRKGDADSLNANGFDVRVKWGGGSRVSSFEVRLQRVSFQPLGPGDVAKGQSTFHKVKPGNWVDTQKPQPKKWSFSIPGTTQFYRLQVRGLNSLGPGPMAEQYFLVMKQNQAAIVFKPGG